MTQPEAQYPEALDPAAAEQPPAPRWAWIATAGLVVVVLGAAGAVVAIDAQANNAGDVRAIAEDYAAAVAGGDFDRAQALFGGSGGALAPAVEVEAEAFASATHIVDPRVRELRVDFDAGRASGTVAYELGGSPYTDRIELARDADDEWRVLRGLRYDIEIDPQGAGALGFRGTSDPLPANAGSVSAYAGEYTLVSHNEYYTTVPDPVLRVASSDTTLYASDWVQEGPGFADEVRRQVTRWYESCARETDVAELQECGIDAPEPDATFSNPLDVQAVVEMQQSPEVSRSDSVGDWLSVEEHGRFTVTYTGTGASNRSATATHTVQATDADFAISPTADGLAVEAYPY